MTEQLTVKGRGEYDDETGDWLPSDETITVSDRVLYHWSPRARRRQIKRYGLRPRMRPTITSPGWKAPYVCFAEDPSWAWELSGRFHRDSGTWDLWQVWLSSLDELEFLESGEEWRDFHEVRSHARVYKRHVRWVAERQA